MQQLLYCALYGVFAMGYRRPITTEGEKLIKHIAEEGNMKTLRNIISDGKNKESNELVIDGKRYLVKLRK